MEVSYVEDLSSYGGPKSCVCIQADQKVSDNLTDPAPSMPRGGQRLGGDPSPAERP